ncbi:hypothetical protein AN639_07945 [Candidatus Epulonipiscium fishelsonii]|uniref:Uncharacterized protein n=1 Tax=Candidatus Epulonipiscium fishelsonii TaxID=77094 RepID=A0ACC8X6Y0_9FIRM|nr:hypothetical protein AN396_12655 [Epulopiscium sp. SCG-B11WGA-EpuloA1]ONI38321.1 hypothetical protein AN639_07945 [Epulopiscium sp. SCG-B05WGA-EpuloA1]
MERVINEISDILKSKGGKYLAQQILFASSKYNSQKFYVKELSHSNGIFRYLVAVDNLITYLGIIRVDHRSNLTDVELCELTDDMLGDVKFYRTPLIRDTRGRYTQFTNKIQELDSEDDYKLLAGIDLINIVPSYKHGKLRKPNCEDKTSIQYLYRPTFTNHSSYIAIEDILNSKRIDYPEIGAIYDIMIDIGIITNN